MKRRISKNPNRSVLNTDAFDKRRFREIFEMSPALQRVRAESEMPMFESLLADIWASLYKMKPKISVHVDSVLKVNKTLMERIMADEHHQNYRSFTRLDDLSSAICTVQFGEKMNHWLAERQKEDEELHKQIQHILEMNIQFQRQEWREGTANEGLLSEGNFTELISNLDKKLRQMIEENSESFSQAFLQAKLETKQLVDDLKSLLGGIKAGKGDGDLKKVPLRDQLSLADKLASDKKMKEIADWAGRFKQVARKKQKTRYTMAMERSGVILGNDMERLLPVELGLYTHPTTKNDFLRRFVEGQTMMYEQEGKEILGRGPIILCLDQSGSMRSLDTQAKGFTLALLSIARRQRRDFCLILFSTRTEVFIYEKGKVKSSDIVNLAQSFLSGGTNFTLPLSKSLSLINESRFKQADVIFVTDGEDNIDDSFLDEFIKKKKEKCFNVLSFVVGTNANSVDRFSDKVVMLSDFEDEGSYVAFQI